MVSTLDFKLGDPSLIIGRSQYLENLNQRLQITLVKTKLLKNDFQVVRCLRWPVGFQKITISIANDSVENISHLIPLGLETGTLCVLGTRNNHYSTESLQG